MGMPLAQSFLLHLEGGLLPQQKLPGSLTEMDGQGRACWDPHVRADAPRMCEGTVALG